MLLLKWWLLNTERKINANRKLDCLVQFSFWLALSILAAEAIGASVYGLTLFSVALHTLLHANRKGVDNLCNCIQSVFLPLCTSPPMHELVCTRCCDGVDDADQFHNQIHYFVVRSMWIPLRFVDSTSRSIHIKPCSNRIKKFLCWSHTKKNRKIPHFAHQMVASLRCCCCCCIVIISLGSAIPLSHWTLPLFLPFPLPRVDSMTMRCSKVFLTHCDGLSWRVNNMRLNKSLDCSEHTRSTTETPATIARPAKTSQFGLCCMLIYIHFAWRFPKKRKKKKKFVKRLNSHYVAHIGRTQCGFFYTFWLLFEARKGKRRLPHGEQAERKNKCSTLVWVTASFIYSSSSYVFFWVLFCFHFDLLSLAWKHHVAAFHFILLPSLPSSFRRPLQFRGPNSIFNFIQSSINVVVSHPVKGRAMAHGFVVSEICITYAVWQQTHTTHLNHVAERARYKKKNELQRCWWSKFRLTQHSINRVKQR